MKNTSPHIIISGYYGYGSIGDEAVLFSILFSVAKIARGSHVSVLTSDKSTLPHIDGISVTGVDRLNIFAVIKSLITADIFISGGGSLLQDKTSKRSLCYYCALIRLAKLFRAKIYVYANGIGPLDDIKRCKRALSLADRISVRDPDSLAIAKMLCPQNTAISLTADPVFAYPFSKNREFFLACLRGVSRKPFFAVSLRKCANERPIDLDTLSRAFQQLSEKGLIPVFVSMQNSLDLELCRRAAAVTGGIVADVRCADELFFLLEKAEFAVGMRLHFLLTAAIAGTPSVALSYDRKVESCLSYLGCGRILNAFDFSADELFASCETTSVGFDRKRAEELCRGMKARALQDEETLAKLIEQPQLFSENKKTTEKFFADT